MYQYNPFLIDYQREMIETKKLKHQLWKERKSNKAINRRKSERLHRIIIIVLSIIIIALLILK